MQLDAVSGCPALMLPPDHLARKVARILAAIDTGSVEKGYSSLGRRGYHPRSVLAVWVYASLIGMHESTKVERALKTDAAFRFLSGGHALSGPVLRRFRQKQGALFEAALVRTVAIAKDSGLLKTDELATDSVRLRAHASNKAARTLERSEQRLQELAKTDTASLTEEQRRKHEGKVAKHTQAVEECRRQGRTNLVTTNPLAGLLKFPNGASQPGHRATVIGAGVKARLAVGLLLDSSATDFGKLEQAVLEARRVLQQAGAIGADTKLRVRADAGYWCTEDLAFAARCREWLDVLIAESASARKGTPSKSPRLGREHFVFLGDGKVKCPAGTLMSGPRSFGGGKLRYTGRGCANCPQKAQCAPGRRRELVVDPALEKGRDAMRERMDQPDASRLYGQRMAIIEPIFASIEADQGYRRVTSRHPQTVRAEILLKLLAHNVGRLIAARPISLAVVLLGVGEPCHRPAGERRA